MHTLRSKTCAAWASLLCPLLCPLWPPCHAQAFIMMSSSSFCGAADQQLGAAEPLQTAISKARAQEQAAGKLSSVQAAVLLDGLQGLVLSVCGTQTA